MLFVFFDVIPLRSALPDAFASPTIRSKQPLFKDDPRIHFRLRPSDGVIPPAAVPNAQPEPSPQQEPSMARRLEMSVTQLVKRRHTRNER